MFRYPTARWMTAAANSAVTGTDDPIGTVCVYQGCVSSPPSAASSSDQDAPREMRSQRSSVAGGMRTLRGLAEVTEIHGHRACV